MSLPLDNKTLIREAWLTALEQEGDRQCCGYWKNGDSNKSYKTGKAYSVCAMSKLIEIVLPDLPYSNYGRMAAESCAARAGLTNAMGSKIVSMNDRRWSFERIAAEVRSWF